MRRSLNRFAIAPLKVEHSSSQQQGGDCPQKSFLFPQKTQNPWREIVFQKKLTAIAVVVMLLGALSATAQAAPSYNIYTCNLASGPNGSVMLSFDDLKYSDPMGWFRELVSISESTNTGFLTFPVTNPRVPGAEEYLRSHGIWVGNHTQNHRDLTKLSNAQVRAEILNGVRSNLIRYPYGAHSPRVDRIASELGYRPCLWTYDTNDWQGKSAAQVVSEVLANVHPGQVHMVLMHQHTQSINGLREMIAGLRARGVHVCARPPGPVPADIPNPIPCG